MRQVDVGEVLGQRQPLDLERDVAAARAVAARREHLAERAPDHAADDLVAVRRARLARGHDAAVLHDRDAVAEAEHVGQLVRDVDDGGAAVAQLAHHPEEVLVRFRRQRGGRLVHDDQPRAVVQRAGDLGQLLVGDRQLAGDPARVEARADDLEQLGRAPAHAALVEHPGAAQLVAEEDVGRHAQLRDQAELLVDDDDVGAERVAGVAEVDDLAVEVDLALVGLVDAGDDLRQRRLAGAVLAHEPVDLAARKASETSASAWTGPKRLLTPCTDTTGAEAPVAS